MKIKSKKAQQTDEAHSTLLIWLIWIIVAGILAFALYKLFKGLGVR